MKDLLIYIRKHAGLTQSQFAEELGLTFATINRWENGHAEPNRLAQRGLYDFCRANSIPVDRFTIDRIKKETDSINAEDRLLLYHSSKAGITGEITPSSRKRCDFGSGFYMGTDPLQPLTLTCDYDSSRFYIVSLDTSALEIKELDTSLEWAMFIAFNRGRMDGFKGTELYGHYSAIAEEYDLISGPIADDRMFYVLDNFFQGNITDAALLASLSALKLGDQYSAIKGNACKQIRIEKEIPISILEKEFLKDRSSENRMSGISLADEICRKHRREGLFFDEILDKENSNG